MVRRTSARAFTLIELLLVLVILAVLASVALPLYFGKMDSIRKDATNAEISNLKSALAHFELSNGRFPTTAEGLIALVQMPPGLETSWDGPYIERISEDKWGHTYYYASPGTDGENSYDLASAGKDGIFNTADDLTK